MLINLLNILRYFIFIPISVFIMILINTGILFLISKLITLNTFIFFLVLFFLGGLIWNLFKIFAGLLVAGATFIVPNVKFGTYTLLLLSVLNGLFMLYKVWTQDISYGGWEIFYSICSSFLVLELTFVLVIGCMARDE